MKLYLTENHHRVKALVLAESPEQAVELVDSEHGESSKDFQGVEMGYVSHAEEVELDEARVLFVDYNSYADNRDREWGE